MYAKVFYEKETKNVKLYGFAALFLDILQLCR